MDLLQTVRKEGSRGGRSEFKWEDVKNDGHRENYLGHSLMAPVGRWQRGRDLSWYAKADDTPAQKSEAEKRAEELRKIKEAEEDAMAKALGLPPPDRSNANLTPLGEGGADRAKQLESSKVDVDKGRSERTSRGRDKGANTTESGRLRSLSPDSSRRKEHRRRDRSSSRHRHRRRRSRSRSGDRRKHRHRSRSREEDSERRRKSEYSRRRSRSRSRHRSSRRSHSSHERTDRYRRT